MPEHYSNQLKAIFSEFVIDAMNGIIVFDGNDQIIFSNNSAAEIYGLTDGSLLYGKTFNQMVSHCHHTNTGLIINTDDLDTWLE